ncbi:MAG: N-acetylmuramoyl-L-alanine amidase [Deltaproteobacteria bacterium]|nr:N-acetylmuramoyl-L-alanine amidase [Deltaproteobacteria bacterium]
MRSRNTIWALVTVLIWLVFPLSAAVAGHVLMIDPAHGGKDAGVKLSRTVHEKDVTLAIARLIKKNLSNTDDIKVRLTRPDDRDLSSAERKKILKRSDADLFISLHVNAGFGQKAQGYEIYYLGAAIPSAQKDDSGEILKDMEQTIRLNNSVLLAQIVQKEIGMVFPRKGRGLRDAPVHLLRSLTTPAILLEVGFSTNIEDRKKLRDTKVQKSVADALTRSVKKYFLTDGGS